MKRSDAFPSNYIGKDDVPDPVIAIIDDVERQPIRNDAGGTDDKPVMTFAHGQFKPLILNNINWMTLEDAYGEDSDDWRGKPVEIYVDPSVMFAGRRVGGVRLRIPTADASRPVPRKPSRPAAPPVSDLAAQHAQALRDLAQADTVDQLEAIRRRSNLITFDEAQFAELDHVYEDRRYDLSRVATNRRQAVGSR